MAKNSSATLLSLPKELRLEIYEFLFLPASAYIDPVAESIKKADVPSPATLSVLCTCRQVYNEARDVAYTTYTFSVRRDILVAEIPQIANERPGSLITTLLFPPHPGSPCSRHLLCTGERRFNKQLELLCACVRYFPVLREIYYVVERREGYQTALAVDDLAMNILYYLRKWQKETEAEEYELARPDKCLYRWGEDSRRWRFQFLVRKRDRKPKGAALIIWEQDL